MRRLTPLLMILCLSLAPFALSVQASDIVVNGDFDANSPPDGTAPVDWTLTHASSGSDFFVGSGPGFGAFSPPNSANFGAVGDFDDELSQVLATVVGDSYTLTYELAHDDTDSENDFSVTWGGVLIPGSSLLNAAEFGYTLFTFTDLLATSSSTTLAFFGREVPAWYDLDNVSVTGTSAIPEPASLLLLGTVLMGLAGYAKGRFRRTN